MEVEILEMLELDPRRGEELLGGGDVPIHRAADVEEHQHLDRVAPLGPHVDVEVALLCRAAHRVVEVELLGCAFARKAAKPAQRHFDVARAKLDVAGQVLVLALVPHFHRAEIAIPVLADAHAGGVIAMGPVWRGTSRADPFRAALMAALLLGEALFQLLHDLFPAAQRLDLFLVLFRQMKLRDEAKPLLRHLRLQLAHQLEALEDVAEHHVELVEVALVLHQRGAGKVVEVFDAPVGEVGIERFQKRQILLQRHRDLGASQLIEELDEHLAAPGLRSGAEGIATRTARQAKPLRRD